MQISLFIHIHTLCPQNNYDYDYDYEERLCYIFCNAKIHVLFEKIHITL